MLTPPMLSTHFVKNEVIRRPRKRLVRGRPVQDPPEIYIVEGSFQPVLKSTDTMQLPEGERTKKALKVYTRNHTTLREANEAEDGWDADQFWWKGELYEVVKTASYDMRVLDHVKAMCVRVEGT
ncbi:hypothetical protein VL2_gp149 [Pseudomonas phage vB_PaeM_VL12]|uniref:Head-tail joining protein n=14 Tax=Nankokuvirus TaxID=1925779 RepID=A0A218L3W1_9CAUD|nr:hypothetical protein [Pseudomonas aeruginosa]YP_004306758.1 head protein [Pseudomonas phage KPP10]YP_008856885.1 head protein [Pseudomonas phage PAK_P5]YP_008857644.1 head protein [Pseudomonas phage PAK_P3]YP_008858032.1 head protein [Pseudomonas phage CHA_P1]YP_009124461.1 head protein [Pseudomonas phage vB_PaeM_PAO1_Ab03]YP_009206023.1 head protein [Pseudomonas phage vB_PaeM_PS24]YP_009604686.1 head protein [Pseudomonas phage vB_PaeM_G1]AGS81686.1 hypothetical protein P3_CHA0009 [Pseud